MRLVTIEFTQDTKDADGNIVRSAGSQMRVDPMSAKSFVEVKKVAKLAGASAEKAVAKTAKAHKAEKVAPEPPTAPVEPVAEGEVQPS